MGHFANDFLADEEFRAADASVATEPDCPGFDFVLGHAFFDEDFGILFLNDSFVVLDEHFDKVFLDKIIFSLLFDYFIFHKVFFFASVVLMEFIKDTFLQSNQIELIYKFQICRFRHL